MAIDIDCTCGIMKVHMDAGPRNYIFECIGCGKKHKGGFWIGRWLQGLSNNWKYYNNG